MTCEGLGCSEKFRAASKRLYGPALAEYRRTGKVERMAAQLKKAEPVFVMEGDDLLHTHDLFVKQVTEQIKINKARMLERIARDHEPRYTVMVD